MRKLYVAVIVFAVVAIVAIMLSNRNGLPLPEGNYVAEQSTEWMRVANDIVRIGRDKSSFSVLPNKTNVKLFDQNDLSHVHPQYLRIIDNDTVEWAREASGPSPRYKIIFRKK